VNRLSDEELEKAQRIIAARGECAGPLTTFEDGLSKVGILCRDNWDDVIRWLAECERVFPAALSELRERRKQDAQYGDARPDRAEVDRVARILIAAWAKAEPDHGVTKHPVSYRATFADMARAVIAERRSQDLDSNEQECLAAMRRDLGKSNAFAGHAWYDAALSVLDRLLKVKP